MTSTMLARVTTRDGAELAVRRGILGDDRAGNAVGKQQQQQQPSHQAVASGGSTT